MASNNTEYSTRGGNLANALTTNLSEVVFGQPVLVESLGMALVVNGTIDGEGAHVLIEDIPGSGKTFAAKNVAPLVPGLEFARIQMTPDMMNSDVVGNKAFLGIDPDSKEEIYARIIGPVKANILLADELNRASTKSQAALLQAMGEGEITLYGDDEPIPLKDFLVIATQNPLDQQGTNPLPQAQVDRFLYKVSDLGYLKAPYRRRLLDAKIARRELVAERALSLDQLDELREIVVNKTKPQGGVVDFIDSLVDKLQAENDDRILVGPSPRADIGLFRSAQFIAVLADRSHVIKEDVVSVAERILAHRIILNPSVMMTGVTEKQIVDEAICSLMFPKGG